MAIIENILIQRARQGDSAAFGKLVLQYRDRVLALAYDMTGNYTDAQDVAQETFMAAFKNINTYKKKSALYTWLYRITVNKAYDLHRKKRNSSSLEDVDTGALYQPGEDSTVWDANLDTAAANKRINEAMQLLTEQQRTAVVLKYFHGLSSSEIGETMEISGNTVRTHLLRALEKLKPVLKDLQDVVE